MKKIKITASIGLLLIMQSFSYAQDWSLENCLQYAQAHNKDLLAQEEALQASSHNRQAAVSELFPEITGRAEMDHFWQIPVQAFPAELVGGEPGTFVPIRISTPWTASYGAEASLSLIDPQKWQSIKLSSLQVQQQEHELSSINHLLERNIAMAFHVVQSEEQNLRAMRRLNDNYGEIHRLIALQFDKGIIDQITFNQSRKLQNDRKESLEQAGLALRAAYLDLKFWMGYPLKDSLSIATTARDLPGLVEGEFTDQLNDQLSDHSNDQLNGQLNGQSSDQIPVYKFNPQGLPDYEVRRLQQKQTAQQWRMARSRMLPRLSAVAGYQRVAFRNSFDFLEGGDWFNVGSIGLRLQVPILSLRQMKYEPSRQKALWKQANYQFERFQEEQERNFQKENMQLAQAYKVWQNQQENLSLARENEALTIRKIEQGLIDMLQLRQVQDDLSQAQQSLSRAKLNYLRHFVTLSYMQNKEIIE